MKTALSASGTLLFHRHSKKKKVVESSGARHPNLKDLQRFRINKGFKMISALVMRPSKVRAVKIQIKENPNRLKHEDDLSLLEKRSRDIPSNAGTITFMDTSIVLRFSILDNSVSQQNTKIKKFGNKLVIASTGTPIRP